MDLVLKEFLFLGKIPVTYSEVNAFLYKGGSLAERREGVSEP